MWCPTKKDGQLARKARTAQAAFTTLNAKRLTTHGIKLGVNTLKS